MALAYAFSDTTQPLGEETDTRAEFTGEAVLVGSTTVPIHVTIERAPAGYYTVRDPDTGIFGQGDSSQEAAQDFLQALREHADVLAQAGALTSQLDEHLRILNKYLGRD